MFINKKNTIAVSNFGWVDKSALWIYDVKKDQQRHLTFSKADYINLKLGNNGKFIIIHHFDSPIILLSAHDLDKPDHVISEISYSEQETKFKGDLSIWNDLPKYFTLFFKGTFESDYYLFEIDAKNHKLIRHSLDWFDSNYDRGYQGILDVTEMDDAGLVIVSIQRDSNPVIYDVNNRQVVRKILLADRNGNPIFHRFCRRNEIWATDYDTIIRLSKEDWQILQIAQMQPEINGVRGFIGNLNFNVDEGYVIVPRPFSNDVALVETNNLKIQNRLQTHAQPLVAVSTNDKIIARDWKTGDVLLLA